MRSLLASALVLFCFSQTARAETDALGSPIPDGTKARIVTLAPSLAELVAALDPEHLDHIKGVTEYTDFPPALEKVESVGPYNRFNIEKVVALKPDLVLATKDGNAEDQVRHLKELGLKVVVVDTASLSLVARSMKLVGVALGLPEAGERMAKSFEDGLVRVKARATNRPARKVLLQLGEEPLIVAGGEAFLSEALSVIGARNIYADARGRYPRPSVEDAVARDPDAIVVLAMGDPKPFEGMAGHWGGFPKLKAVKAHRVKVLTGDSLVKPTLRLLDGLLVLEEAVYGP